MKLLFLLLGSISFAAASKCNQKTALPADHTPLVQLETQGCRGFCPTYKLLFRNDGVVEYEGRRNMVKPGLDTIELTAVELKNLRAAVLEVNLWQYPERIESQVADAPTASLTVFNAEKSHAVYGSIDRPKPILDLEEKLKNLAEIHGLKVKEGVNPYTAPANQQEVMVKFKPDVNPGNFLMNMEPMRLRIVRRVSAENLWIIGYNPDQIKEKELIDLLKGMDGVLEVTSQK